MGKGTGTGMSFSEQGAQNGMGENVYYFLGQSSRFHKWLVRLQAFILIKPDKTNHCNKLIINLVLDVFLLL